MYGGFLVSSITVLLFAENHSLVTPLPFAPSRYFSDTETGKYFLRKANGTRLELSKHNFERGVLDERRKRTAGNVANVAFFVAIAGLFYPDISKSLSNSRKDHRNHRNLLKLKNQ